jgi:hemerythrin-like metal-binding protein
MNMSITPVKVIEWAPELSFGIARMDELHKSWLNIVNRFHEAMLNGEGDSFLRAESAKVNPLIFNRLELEDELMAAVHYPDIQAHIQEHDAIRSKARIMMDRIERDDTPITIEVMQVVLTETQRHFLSDIRLRDYIQVERSFAAYLERLLQGDQRGCGLIVRRLLAGGISFKEIYGNLFQRAMYRTGELWMRNEISSATEHLVTNTTLSMMSLVSLLLHDSPRNGKKAVVTCVGGEFHQVGAQMISDAFDFLGWDSFFLGANTPVEGLLDLLEEKQPDVLCLSVSLSSHIRRFKETVKKTHARFPDLAILAGGQAFLHNKAEAHRDPHLQILRSLDELEAWAATR